LLAALVAMAVMAGVALLALALWLGESLTRAANRPVGPPPAGLQAEAVHIAHASGAATAGWIAPGVPGAGAVLLLHPVRSDRRAMLARARFLQRAGHAVLLVDLQAHGETAGTRIGFGWLEARDVEASLGWLASRFPGERLGIVGVSLGGAASVYARPSARPAAMVLEAVYPDIRAAIGNRLRLHLADRPGGGALAALLQPLLLAQGRVWLGVDAERLSPRTDLAQTDVPLLLISGELDRHTTPEDSARLLRSARGRAQLWLLPGAGHEDLHAHAPAAYEARVGAFLGRHLRQAGSVR